MPKQILPRGDTLGYRERHLALPRDNVVDAPGLVRRIRRVVHSQSILVYLEPFETGDVGLECVGDLRAGVFG